MSFNYCLWSQMLLINLNLYLTLNILLIWLFVLTSHRRKTFCWCLMFISWRATSLGVGNVVPCPDATLVRKYCSYLTLAHTHAPIKERRNTHANYKHTLEKSTNTKVVIRNQEHSKKNKWGDGEKWWEKRFGQRRLERASEESHRFQNVPRQSQAQGEGEQHANLKRLCSDSP